MLLKIHLSGFGAEPSDFVDQRLQVTKEVLLFEREFGLLFEPGCDLTGMFEQVLLDADLGGDGFGAMTGANVRGECPRRQCQRR